VSARHVETENAARCGSVGLSIKYIILDIAYSKVVASIVRATDFGPAVMLPCYSPINHTRPSPRNPYT